MGSNTGELLIPATFAAGRYKVTVTAEDFAHNIGSREVEIEILP
jgi:Ca-activated chloride channel family protein